MTEEQLIEYLQSEGYSQIRHVPNRGLVGLCRFAYTIGLVYGLNSVGYIGRYCYSNMSDAYNALETWTGEGDPPDSDWIKHKGEVEYSNPLRKQDY